MYNQTKHTTNKSVPTPPTCYLHWIGCVTTYGLILTKSARFAFKPTHPPVGFSPMGARSVYLQSMMRSKMNKDVNIQNYNERNVVIVFDLFLLVSLNNICRGKFRSSTAASQDNQKDGTPNSVATTPATECRYTPNSAAVRNMSLHTELSGCTQLE